MNNHPLSRTDKTYAFDLYRFLILSVVTIVVALIGHQLLPEKTLQLIPYYIHESYVFLMGRAVAKLVQTGSPNRSLVFIVTYPRSAILVIVV